MVGRRERDPNLHPPKAVSIGFAGVLIAGAIFAARGAYEKFASQPQLPDKPPISGSRVPGAAAAEQEKQKIPMELQRLMQYAGGFFPKEFVGRSMQGWLNSFPNGTEVNVTFYPKGIMGTVVSDIGVNGRELPTDQTFRRGSIAWGHPVGTEERPPRFKIKIAYPDGTSEEWLGLERYFFRTTDPSRYQYMQFFAANTPKDGMIIGITKEDPNSITVPLRPQRST